MSDEKTLCPIYIFEVAKYRNKKARHDLEPAMKIGVKTGRKVRAIATVMVFDIEREIWSYYHAPAMHRVSDAIGQAIMLVKRRNGSPLFLYSGSRHFKRPIKEMVHDGFIPMDPKSEWRVVDASNEEAFYE